MKTITATFICVCTACQLIDPPASVTLLVTNATCNAGGCEPLIIGAFTSIPALAPSTGQLQLGRVNSESACLTIPGSERIGSSTWTPADSLSLVASDSLTLYLIGETHQFLAQAEPGWSVTFSGSVTTDVPVSVVAPASPCTP
jgi:hypothetical protein